MEYDVQVTERLRLAEAVAALSLATDLGMGQPMGYGLRSCLLAVGLVRDGRIVEPWATFDRLGMRQQLGALPTPEKAMEASAGA